MEEPRPVPASQHVSAKDRWCFKIRRYDGSDSVLGFNLTQNEAEEMADEANTHEQTDQYYAEQWDPDKHEAWFPKKHH